MDRTPSQNQIKELERENNGGMIFGLVNQRFVVLILTLGKRIRVGIKSERSVNV